jgi:outer membrane protein
MNKKQLIGGVAALALSSISSVAMAHEAGDWLFRFGGSGVFPKSNNNPIVKVDDGYSVSFTLTWMWTDHWAVDVLAAWPFKHDIQLRETNEKVASVKHLPPTVSLQYHFLPDSLFQPYVGVGVNYTYFFDEKTTGPIEGLKLDVDSSWGLAAQIGADFMINETWFLNGEARWIDIESDAVLAGDPLGKVDIDPWVLSLNAGFRF